MDLKLIYPPPPFNILGIMGKIFFLHLRTPNVKIWWRISMHMFKGPYHGRTVPLKGKGTHFLQSLYFLTHIY